MAPLCPDGLLIVGPGPFGDVAIHRDPAADVPAGRMPRSSSTAEEHASSDATAGRQVGDSSELPVPRHEGGYGTAGSRGASLPAAVPDAIILVDET
jgi:hypothetical protein